MYAFINQKGQMQINKQSDPNTFAWKTHVFVYNEAPLKKVVKELEEVYKVHIGGIPQKEYYLTTTFDNTPIEDIIEIINQTLDTKLRHNPMMQFHSKFSFLCSFASCTFVLRQKEQNMMSPS